MSICRAPTMTMFLLHEENSIVDIKKCILIVPLGVIPNNRETEKTTMLESCMSHQCGWCADLSPPVAT
jgi:hypothetical protein